ASQMNSGAVAGANTVTGAESFTYVATDSLGNTVTGTITVDIIDDVPQTPVFNTSDTVMLKTFDGGLTAGNFTGAELTGDTDISKTIATAAFAGAFTVTADAGADGGTTATVYALQLDAAYGGGTIGLTSGGNDIYLYNIGGVIVGSTSSTNPGSVDGTAVFTLGVDASGNVTLTQLLVIDHGSDVAYSGVYIDDVQSLGDNLVELKATATTTDGDGDTAANSATIDLGGNVKFGDDGPDMGPVQDGTASNVETDAVTTGSLNFEAGADGFGSVVDLTLDTTGLTSGGKPLVTVLSGNVLTAYADLDDSGGFTPGDTAVFTVTIDPNAGPSNGIYTFDLIAPLDPTVIPSPVASALGSGAGPSAQLNLLDASNDPISIVSGWDITGSFNRASWFAGSGIAVADVSISSANGTAVGFGVQNGNFTKDEFFRFDFGPTVNDFDAGGPYTAQAITLPEVQYIDFKFENYSSSDVIEVVAYYTDGTVSSGETITGNDIDGTNPTYRVTAPGTKTIDYVEMLSVNANGSGKVLVGDIGTIGTQIDTDIDFTVQLSDGDGDSTAAASFTVNVADSNVPSSATPPVVLDLDGDGIETVDLSTSTVNFDYNGDGVASKTAWVGADDGLLAIDLNNDGKVNDGSEIVFSQYAEGAETDLEGLAMAFDTNQDGVLNADDAQFDKFGVWQDADSDGVTDDGEFKTLAEMGIESIDLTNDGDESVSEDGSVTTFGYSEYTNTDGSTGIVGDVAFANYDQQEIDNDIADGLELGGPAEAGETYVIDGDSAAEIIADMQAGIDEIDLGDILALASEAVSQVPEAASGAASSDGQTSVGSNEADAPNSSGSGISDEAIRILFGDGTSNDGGDVV
ncbi:MAG: hypothetical protein ABJL64_09285, partial [Rhizobiaceae bacterium]